MENQPIDKHAYERLHSEVAELLLKPDSLARTTEEIKPLFQEYQSLQARQGELKSLEIKIAEMIPVIEQTEVEVAKAKRQLADEEKVLGTFAEELGRSVFAGFQAGVILDQPFLSPRKELQVRIDELQAKRSILQSEQRTGLLEKTKQQAHLLALAGQIKFEEVNVGSTDRLVGEAILGSKEKLTIKCSYTEQVLKAIIEQQHRIAPARGKLKSAEELVIQRKAECGAKLGRAAVQSSDLKAELKELRGEAVRNTNQMNGIREQVVDIAIKSEVAMLDATISLKLRELRKLQESRAANKFKFANRLGPVMDLWKKLPAGKRRTIFVTVGVTAGLLLLGLTGRWLMNGGSEVSMKAGADKPAMPIVKVPVETDAENVTSEKVVEKPPETKQPKNTMRPPKEAGNSPDLVQQNARKRWRSPNEIYEEMRSIDQESARDIRYVEFQIARKVSPSLYQCMITRFPPATEILQIPAIIKTTETEYNSMGKASLLVKYVKEESLSTEDGFSKDYIFFEEIAGGTTKDYDTHCASLKMQYRSLAQELIATILHEQPTKPDESQFDLTRRITLKPSPKFRDQFARGRTFEPSRSASGVLMKVFLSNALNNLQYSWGKGFDCVQFAVFDHDVELLELLLLKGEKVPSKGNAADRLRELAKQADSRKDVRNYNQHINRNLDKVLDFLASH